MTEVKARLFRHGGSQAVRLPKDFRLPGDQVRVRRLGRGVLLEPLERTPEQLAGILKALDGLRSVPFMDEGRQQPAMPSAEDVTFD